MLASLESLGDISNLRTELVAVNHHECHHRLRTAEGGDDDTGDDSGGSDSDGDDGENETGRDADENGAPENEEIGGDEEKSVSSLSGGDENPDTLTQKKDVRDADNGADQDTDSGAGVGLGNKACCSAGRPAPLDIEATSDNSDTSVVMFTGVPDIEHAGQQAFFPNPDKNSLQDESVIVHSDNTNAVRAEECTVADHNSELSSEGDTSPDSELTAVRLVRKQTMPDTSQSNVQCGKNSTRDRLPTICEEEEDEAVSSEENSLEAGTPHVVRQDRCVGFVEESTTKTPVLLDHLSFEESEEQSLCWAHVTSASSSEKASVSPDNPGSNSESPKWTDLSSDHGNGEGKRSLERQNCWVRSDFTTARDKQLPVFMKRKSVVLSVCTFYIWLLFSDNQAPNAPPNPGPSSSLSEACGSSAEPADHGDLYSEALSGTSQLTTFNFGQVEFPFRALLHAFTVQFRS